METKPRPYYPTKAAWATAQADKLDRQAAELEAAPKPTEWHQRRSRDEAIVRLIAEARRFRGIAERLAKKHAA